MKGVELVKSIERVLPEAAQYGQIIQSIISASEVTETIRSSSSFAKLTKSDSSPVTIADLAAQAIIVSGIQYTFPNDHIIAEEDLSALTDANVLHQLNDILLPLSIDMSAGFKLAKESKSRFWTVDPIDGTKGFLRNGQYAICASLVKDCNVSAAFIACPNLPSHNSTGAFFIALKNLGAHEFSLQTGQHTRLQKKVDALKGSVLYESFEAEHSSHSGSAKLVAALGLNPNPLRLDSQCKYCLLARHEASLYFRQPRSGYIEKIWVYTIHFNSLF